MPTMSNNTKIFNESDAGFALCSANNNEINNEKLILSTLSSTNEANNSCYPGGFEGPEKKLDIRFRPIARTGKNQPNRVGLRAIGRERWQSVLDYARCSIISQTSNQFIDSYVLSESSLFVYSRRVMIKTCGTTTLLHLIEHMIALATEVGLEVEMVVFSRKNLNQPNKQVFPHCNFNDEVEYLNKVFGSDNGHAYVMGPLTRDHWNVYIADMRKSSPIQRTEQTFEVMMHDLDPQIMKQFFKREGVSAWETTVSSGISNLIPGSIIDDFQFDPCGYSMNGLLDRWYWTIHITPEDHCSYVSFDTNIALPSYSQLLANILKVFRPGRFTAALYAEDGSPCGDPYSTFDVTVGVDHVITNKTIHSFDGGYDVIVCNYEIQQQQQLQLQQSQQLNHVLESSQQDNQHDHRHHLKQQQHQSQSSVNTDMESTNNTVIDNLIVA